MNINLGKMTTFAASVVLGCGAAIAIASTAAVSQSAPSLRQGAPVEVVRLAPVVVTISKARYDELRGSNTELARSTDARKVTRG